MYLKKIFSFVLYSNITGLYCWLIPQYGIYKLLKAVTNTADTCYIAVDKSAHNIRSIPYLLCKVHNSDFLKVMESLQYFLVLSWQFFIYIRNHLYTDMNSSLLLSIFCQGAIKRYHKKPSYCIGHFLGKS